MNITSNTSLAAAGALAHCLQHRTTCNTAPPATPQRLQHCIACNTAPPAKFKMATRGTKLLTTLPGICLST